MRRAYNTILASLMLVATPVAPAFAATVVQPSLSESYNRETDKAFRIGMQMRLAWTGDYAGSFDGEIDAAGLRAIRDFQARHGMPANGVIDEPFLRLLIAESDAAEKTTGFSMVDDVSTGVRIGLPLSLVHEDGDTDVGRVWRSTDGGIEMETVRIAGEGTTLASLYDVLSTPAGSRSITSQEFGKDFFTVSGVESGRLYTMRFAGRDGDVRGFSVSYDARESARMAPVVTLAANLFDPFMTQAEPPMIVAGGHLDGLGAVSTRQAAADGRDPGSRNGTAALSLFDASVGGNAGIEASGTVAATPSQDSSGSGFVVSRDGWLLTNAHVARACKTIMVGEQGPADKVILDETNDLALVHATGTLGAPLAISAGKPRLGEDVLALGYPLRSILADSLNVTRGNVSSLMGLMNDPRYLQISAPIQPGNSGGPLVDLAGRVVGVVTAKLNAVAIADATGDIPQSINFAIRPDAATRFLDANGIGYARADPAAAFGSVADTTANVEASILPILCLGDQ